MAFDVDRLIAKAEQAIAKFAAHHETSGEVFCGFAIDGDSLCFESVSHFEWLMSEFPRHYETAEQLEQIKMSVGDWKYQAFESLEHEDGFDRDAYQEHYDLGLESGNKEKLLNSPYALAMEAVLQGLIAKDAFRIIRRSEDFKAIRVEHDY